MAKLELAFDILARDKASGVLDGIGDKADTVGSKLGSMGGKAKALAGGAAVGGIAALGAAMVQGVKDAASFEKLQAKTAAVIESTGNAANISVGGVQELAGSLESLSGVDEEEIINSQNILATFTKIKNAGPDKVFDDAAEAALNMSVALGTDLTGATLQIGKALNNPIAGLSALGRAGVQFTEQQKEQIKAMVAAGDTMGAQKAILGELETQFGGAAEAAGSGFAGSMARLQDAVGDAFREIGQELIPILTDLAEWLAKNLPGAIDDFKRGLGIVSNFMQTYVWPVIQTGADIFQNYLVPAISAVVRFATEKLYPTTVSVISWFGDVIARVREVIEWFGNIASKIGEVASTVGTKVGEIVGFFTGLPGRLARGAGDVFGFLRDGFVEIVNFIIRAWNAIDFTVPKVDLGPLGSFGGFTVGLNDINEIGNPGPSRTLSPGGMFRNLEGLANGVRGWRGGMALVGEVGPELVNLPRGADVFSSRESLAMLRPGGNVINVYEANRYDEDTLMRSIAARLA